LRVSGSTSLAGPLFFRRSQEKHEVAPGYRCCYEADSLRLA
jgi:hypothetical protein